MIDVGSNCFTVRRMAAHLAVHASVLAHELGDDFMREHRELFTHPKNDVEHRHAILCLAQQLKDEEVTFWLDDTRLGRIALICLAHVTGQLSWSQACRKTRDVMFCGSSKFMSQLWTKSILLGWRVFPKDTYQILFESSP